MRRALLLLSFAALTLSACQEQEAPAQPAPRPVKWMRVQPLAAQAPRFTGTVEPQVSTDYSFQILGRIIAREVDVGDTVAQGEVLASLDASVLQQEVTAAEAALAGANASLANAQGVDERQRALQQSNTATQAVVDQATQALQAARSSQQQATASLDKAREQLGYALIDADFAGVVTGVSAEPGQVVEAGQTVLTVARPDLRDAVVDLPEGATERLTLGMPLDVTLQLDPTIFTPATVREISPLADPVTRSRRVRIALENPPESFRLGTIVTVALATGEPGALTVPDSALLKDDGSTRVFVIPEGSNTVSLRPVTLRNGSGGSWVVESGLGEGDRVVIAGVNSLADGQTVKVDEAGL